MFVIVVLWVSGKRMVAHSPDTCTISTTSSPHHNARSPLVMVFTQYKAKGEASQYKPYNCPQWGLFYRRGGGPQGRVAAGAGTVLSRSYPPFSCGMFRHFPAGSRCRGPRTPCRHRSGAHRIRAYNPG